MTPQVISLSALGSTAWIPVDYKQNPFNLSIACVVSNTPNLTYQVEYTLDDIFDSAITPTAFVHNTITGKTSDFSATQTQPVRAIRLTTTAYTSGTVTMTALQGAVNPIIYTPNPVTLYQSGIPFWLPPGDGGANGLSFTGTRGVFTLSAEAPLASSFPISTSGGYCYLPAGAGGLVTGGLYWFTMTDGTNGEVFANTYSGNGKPDFVSSPTALPDLSAGRITQIVTEVYGPSFIMPGGSMGPNGASILKFKYITNNSAGTKSIRIRTGGGVVWGYHPSTTGYLDQLITSTKQNMGTQTRQVGNRQGVGGWDCGASFTAYASDVTTVDTSVDQTMTFTMQIPANTDSLIMIPLQFTVQYGD